VPVTKAAERALWHSPDVRRLAWLSVLAFSSFCLLLGSAPAWASAGGVSENRAGLVTTVMLVCTVLVQGAVPALVRRWGLGPVLAAGLIALGAPAPLYAAGHGLGLLLGAAAVRGGGFAVVTVVGSTLAAAVAPPERRGESIGLYGLAIAVPNLLCVPGGVALTQHGAFRWVAYASALPVLAVPLALALGRSVGAPARGAGSEPGEGAAPPHLANSRAALGRVAAPAFVLLTATLAGGGLVTYLPLQLPTGALATVALLGFGATAALGRWRAGALSDRVGTRLLLPGAVIAAVSGTALVALGLEDGSGSVLVTGAVLFGAGYGAVQNLTLVRAFAAAGPGHATTASAFWNAAFDAGTGIGAIAVGAVAATGLGVPAVLGLTALLMLAALPLTTMRLR
jgi:predicted MFS family arabinose efflux permease